MCAKAGIKHEKSYYGLFCFTLSENKFTNTHKHKSYFITTKAKQHSCKKCVQCDMHDMNSRSSNHWGKKKKTNKHWSICLCVYTHARTQSLWIEVQEAAHMNHGFLQECLFSLKRTNTPPMWLVLFTAFISQLVYCLLARANFSFLKIYWLSK